MAVNAKELEKILKAVASKRRIEILRFIRAKREISVGDIAEEVRISIKAASKHLRVLYIAGFVEREQQGALALYRIADDIPETARKTLALI